jgi:hypothetical protein
LSDWGTGLARRQMKKVVKLASGFGCLISVIGPILALITYPRAKWLFAFILIGFAVLWLNRRFANDPTPQALADQIENLLNGHCYGCRRFRDAGHSRSSVTTSSLQVYESWWASRGMGEIERGAEGSDARNHSGTQDVGRYEERSNPPFLTRLLLLPRPKTCLRGKE